MDDDRINRRARMGFGAALAVVFAAGAVWMAFSSARYTTYQVETQDTVSGLIADSPVEFHGVEVGRVRSVELDGPRSVRILLEVKNGTPVSAATVATITARGLAMRGFTGYVYIALEDTAAGAKPLAILPGKQYPAIAARPSQVLDMDLAIARVDDNVQALTTLVQTLLDPGTVASLKDTAASLGKVSRTLARNDARVRSLLANSERASAGMPAFMDASRATMGRVDTLLDPRTVASLRQLAASLDRVTAMLAANDAKLDRLITRGDEATHELAPLMQTTHDTLLLLQGQVLPEAYRTLTHVDDVSSTLAGVARKAERDPSVLIRGARPPPPGPGEAP